MGKIKVLDKQVAELIAAGEVIERPASIVKELVENAIDAGASKITVEIKGGGIKYIRVTDDGIGIEPEDLDTAFIRHATSKVTTKEDLEAILTFGFRGEALPSIAAMARVEVLTRTATSSIGSRYVIEGSDKGTLYPEGCPQGTSFIVRDVFFNTPARLKFLKKDSYEGSNIQVLLERLALVNCGISFKLIREGEVVLSTPGNGDLKSAIHCTLGRDFAKDLIKVDYSSSGLKVEGYITAPTSSRATRAMENFYINNRFIKSKTCIAALEESYKGQVMTGRFPGSVLNITIPANTVDVNVHPAKTEVRFSDEVGVYTLVYTGCKTALENHARESTLRTQPQQSPVKPNTISPFALKDFDHKDSQYSFNDKLYKPKEQPPATANPSVTKAVDNDIIPQKKPVENAINNNINTVKTTNITSIDTTRTEPNNRLNTSSAPYNKSVEKQPYNPITELLSTAKPVISESPIATMELPEKPKAQQMEATETGIYETVEIAVPVTEKQEDIRVIGQLFETYIMVEKANTMILIDKHAAHESLLYNRLKEEKDIDSQQLLMAITVHLTNKEILIVEEYKDMLEDVGIYVDIISATALLLRAVPTMISPEEGVEVVKELVSKPIRKEFLPKIIDDLYHSIACRAAIKAHDITPKQEMEFITNIVRNNHSVSYCPHGRPVMVEFTKNKIERMFGRNG